MNGSKQKVPHCIRPAKAHIPPHPIPQQQPTLSES
jgi:hypothetical protein